LATINSQKEKVSAPLMAIKQIRHITSKSREPLICQNKHSGKERLSKRIFTIKRKLLKWNGRPFEKNTID